MDKKEKRKLPLMLSLWTVGLIVVLCGIYRAAWWTYLTFFKAVDLKRYRKGQTWAIVTGATDGIGLAFAEVIY